MSRSTPTGSVRFRATVEYDGAAFHGYQVQPNHRTVQGELESRLGMMFDRPTRVIAAGRTDTGVHGAGMEVAFDVPTSWSADELARSLGAMLPPDVAVHDPRSTRADFHPRFEATGRRYEYYVGFAGPLRAARVWSPPSEPDPALLAEGALHLPGRRSFEALSHAGQPHLGVDCAVETATWNPTALGDLRFTIVADRFLHRMVRYIVATLVDVARGRRTLQEWEALLTTGRGRPPEPAPPQALYLTGVRYEDGWNRPPGVPGLWPLEAADREAAGVIATREMEAE